MTIWLVIVRWSKIKELHLHATCPPIDGTLRANAGRAAAYLADSPDAAALMAAWDGLSVIDLAGATYRVAILLTPVTP